MNPTPRPQPSAPTPADDQPVSGLARRVGPPLAIGALVVAAGLLAWLALAPTAIAGPLTDAPFAVPATMVVPPDDDGCLRVVDGDGTVREHCLEELARTRDDVRYIETYFDEQGRLLVGERAELLHLDPVTGEVLGTVDAGDDLGTDGPPRPAPEDAPIEVPEVPDARPLEVYPQGDRVVRVDVSTDGNPTPEEVLLDLEAPPGYDLRDAALSPDGAWVVAVTPTDQVVVAPADGSAPPHVWADVPQDRWIELWRAIRWDGADG